MYYTISYTTTNTMPSILSRPTYVHGNDLIHPDEMRTNQQFKDMLQLYGTNSAFYKEYVAEEDTSEEDKLKLAIIQRKLITQFEWISDFDTNYSISHSIPHSLDLPSDYLGIFKPLLWKKTYWGQNYAFNDIWALSKRATCTEYAFHGTSCDAIPTIFENGFSISHCKRCAYGTGFYFSQDINVAKRYTTPDVHGLRYILIVKLRYSQMSPTLSCSNQWIIRHTKDNYLVVPDTNMIELVGLIVL